MKMESNSNTSGFVLKGFLSIVLFLGSAFIYQTESEQFSSMKRWTSAALQNEFPFAKANEWYQETFGNPFFLSHDADVSVSENNTSPALPINGNVEETFQKKWDRSFNRIRKYNKCRCFTKRYRYFCR